MKNDTREPDWVDAFYEALLCGGPAFVLVKLW
jgi:hypothetical protein